MIILQSITWAEVLAEQIAKLVNTISNTLAKKRNTFKS